MNLFVSMRVFVKIVDKGSSRAAAKALGISPTMVANHLDGLEKHLGETLINRTTRRQSLTDFGQEYYDRSLEILNLVHEAEALPDTSREKPPSGKLTISAPISFGSEALPPAIKAFCNRYPEIRINLSLTDRTIDLIEDDIDVAIRIGNLPDSGLISRHLCPYEMVVCASPDYLALHGTPKKPQELENHHCIAYSGSNKHWKFFRNGKKESVEIKGPLEVNNGRALRKAAVEGMGIIMQPKILLQEDINQGTLTPLFEDYQLPTREIHLIYLRNRRMPSKVRYFIDFMLDTYHEKFN